jgi:hypothetical protein
MLIDQVNADFLLTTLFAGYRGEEDHSCTYVQGSPRVSFDSATTFLYRGSHSTGNRCNRGELYFDTFDRIRFGDVSSSDACFSFTVSGDRNLDTSTCTNKIDEF